MVSSDSPSRCSAHASIGLACRARILSQAGTPKADGAVFAFDGYRRTAETGATIRETAHRPERSVDGRLVFEHQPAVDWELTAVGCESRWSARVPPTGRSGRLCLQRSTTLCFSPRCGWVRPCRVVPDASPERRVADYDRGGDAASCCSDRRTRAGWQGRWRRRQR